MFYAILPTDPATFVVQPDSADLPSHVAQELLERLELHFALPVALASWDQTGRFKLYGVEISEAQASDDSLVWREFELPVTNSNIPF